MGITHGEDNVDAVTTASIVDNEEAFLNAISKDGTWIIAVLNDLKFDQDLYICERIHTQKGDFLFGKSNENRLFVCLEMLNASHF